MVVPGVVVIWLVVVGGFENFIIFVVDVCFSGCLLCASGVFFFLWVRCLVFWF